MAFFAKLKSKFVKKPKLVYLPMPSVQMVEPGLDGRELPAADSKGKVKVGLIVGHEQKNPGCRMAVAPKLTEYAYNQDVAVMAANYAQAKYPFVEVAIIYRDGVGVAGAYLKARQEHCDVVIELHFNEANGQLSGSETLCTMDQDDVGFAHVIHEAICRVFGRGNSSRGVSCISKSAPGNINCHSFPGGANCLVLPFFGDNLEDASLAMEKRTLYSQALIEAVILWAKKVDLVKN